MLPEIIKAKRIALHEDQLQFAQRFGAKSAAAVSLWESGKRKAPYAVIEFCLTSTLRRTVCDKCGGSGLISVNDFIAK